MGNFPSTTEQDNGQISINNCDFGQTSVVELENLCYYSLLIIVTFTAKGKNYSTPTSSLKMTVKKQIVANRNLLLPQTRSHTPCVSLIRKKLSISCTRNYEM